MAPAAEGSRILAEHDAWDSHLEAVTTALSSALDGRTTGRVTLESVTGWTAEFRAHGRTVTTSFRHRTGASAVTGDYIRAVLYGCDFSPIGDEGRPSGFVKSLTVREGFGWDEQMLRELVLEALGLYRYVLGAGAPSDSNIEVVTGGSAEAPSRRRGRRAGSSGR